MAVYLGENKVCTKGGTKVLLSDVSLQDKTVNPTTSTQIIKPDSDYNGLSSVTVNAINTVTQATPSISISNSGLITASSTQSAGYVESGTKNSTKQLTTKSTTTITPSTSSQTIASGTYLTGTQTIKGDSNLIAGNIKNGTSIFGVTGTYVGSGSGGIDTSDATAEATDIRKGKIAYLSSGKTTGTMNELTQVANVIGKYNKNPATVSWRAAGGSNFNQYDNAIQLQWTTGSSYGGYLSGNIPVIALAEPSEFGNVTADKVLSGWTFTSKDGLKIKGTMSTKSLTSDATATAKDIADGKTAYVNGTKLTGTGVIQSTRYTTGQITGTGTTDPVSFDTGLTNVEKVIIIKDSFNTASNGINVLIWDGEKARGSGVSTSGYFSNPSSSAGTFSANGGTVTYTATESKNALFKGSTTASSGYTWYAFGT